MILRVLIVLILLLPACSKDEAAKTAPVILDRNNSCSVCGMIIVDIPGAKAQIHYKNEKVDLFCSTLDMFSFYLQPDRPPAITAIYVNNMGKADWDHPNDHWIDARAAAYVYGGDAKGLMGEALVPFSDLKDAESYVKNHGGKTIKFSDVTMELIRAR